MAEKDIAPVRTQFYRQGFVERVYPGGTITLALWDTAAVRRASEYDKPAHQRVRDWQSRQLAQLEADVDNALNGEYPPRDRLGDDD